MPAMDEAGVAITDDGTEIYFETHGNRGAPAILMGPHFYVSRSPESEPLGTITEAWIAGLREEFFLIVADYPRGIGRSPHPQGISYTPEVAARECELIADAAGADRFGWVGYSFGGALGVQLACRSHRVTALAVGGFPPLNAPFELMLELVEQSAQQSSTLPDLVQPGVLWSSVGFYAPLVSWPERQEVKKLTLPRLAFMGDEDAGQGCSRPIPLAENLKAAEHELLGLGWQIDWLKGYDHVSAIRPEASLGRVRQFFREALLAS